MNSARSSVPWRFESPGFRTLIFLSVTLLVSCASSPRYRSVPAERETSSVPGTGKVYSTGVASYYGKQFHGRKTASGEIYDMYAMTAAHRTLPFGTILEVENTKNGRKIIVKINDRGPFIPGRILDLSKGAAQKLGMLVDGTAVVKLRVRKWGK